MEVPHDWPDKKCGAILSAIRHAAPDNATVLVVEDLMPEEQSDPRGSTLDVIMLTITGGRERTVDQFNLFEGAGRSLLGCPVYRRQIGPPASCGQGATSS
jgi:hypothetical protein